MAKKETKEIKVYGVTPMYDGYDGMVFGSLQHGMHSTYEGALAACKKEMEEEGDEAYIIDDTKSDRTVIHTYDPDKKEWTEETVYDMDEDGLSEYSECSYALYLYETTLN